MSQKHKETRKNSYTKNAMLMSVSVSVWMSVCPYVCYAVLLTISVCQSVGALLTVNKY